MINVEQLLNLSVRLAAPVILICLGGLFSIKVDIFNLALEGFTLFGCFAAVVGTYMTQSVAGGIAFAVLVTLLIALIYALFVFELDVDPVSARAGFWGERAVYPAVRAGASHAAF